MQINHRVLILREAITKIVPMLTQKSVTVTLRGMKAFVQYDPTTLEPTRVNLPYLPDDASDELIDAVNGFLDHEVGHIMFTDAKVLMEAKAKGAEVMNLANIVEDPFIEKQMHRRFVGSAFNLANVSKFFLKEMVEPRLKAAIAAGDEKAIVGQLLVPAVRAWSGQEDFQEFMKDKWHHIQSVVDKIGDDLIDRLPHCQNSRDCLDIAVQMHARINDDAPPPEAPPEEGDESDDSGEAGDESGESGGSSKDDAKKDDKSKSKGKGKEKGKEEPAAAEKGEESDDDTATAEGEGEGEEEGSAPAGAGEEQDEGEEGEQGTTPNLTPAMNEEMKKTFMAALRDLKDFDESVAEALTARAEQESKSSDYLIFTRDSDTMEPLPVTPTGRSRVKHMTEAVDAMLGPMQKDVERMMAARSAAVWTGGHRNGRLHGAGLIRARFGRDDLFRRKQENHTKNVAAQMVVDCSGSMMGNKKLETASYSAYALAALLERLNIANEVIGFTTQAYSPEVAADLSRDPKLREYARYEALNMPIFKTFDERMTSEVMARFAQASVAEDLCSSNIDGECVLIASRRLAARREARKIMFVLSDGRPAGSGVGDFDAHLRASVKMIEKSGVDVVGIGICDESVKKFYPKNVVIRSVAELGGAVMGQLKALLVK